MTGKEQPNLILVEPDYSQIENPSIAGALRQVVDQPPLDPAAITASYRPKNPDLLAEVLAPANPHIIITENDTGNNATEIRTVVTDEYRREHLDSYVDFWDFQEGFHGEVMLGLHTTHLGQPVPETPERKLSPGFKLLGALANASRFVARPTLYIVALTGAVHEQETISMYGAYAQKLRSIGEDEVADKVIMPIYRQEGPHGRYGRAVVKDLWPKMTRAEQFIAREIFVDSFNLVGIHRSKDDRYRLNAGALANSLVDSQAELPDTIDAAQKLVIRSLPEKKRLLKLRQTISPSLGRMVANCVVEAIEECAELDRQHQEQLQAA